MAGWRKLLELFTPDAAKVIAGTVTALKADGTVSVLPAGNSCQIDQVSTNASQSIGNPVFLGYNNTSLQLPYTISTIFSAPVAASQMIQRSPETRCTSTQKILAGHNCPPQLKR